MIPSSLLVNRYPLTHRQCFEQKLDLTQRATRNISLPSFMDCVKNCFLLNPSKNGKIRALQKALVESIYRQDDRHTDFCISELLKLQPHKPVISKSALSAALIIKDIPLFHLLMDLGVLDQQLASSPHPIAKAIENHNHPELERLCDIESHFYHYDAHGNSFLHIAALHHNHEAIRRLSPLMPDVLANSHGQLPIHLSLLNNQNDQSTLKCLIQAGWDVNATDTGGRTPLMWALDSRRNLNRPHLPVVAVFGSQLQSLLALGANPHCRDEQGQSALLKAIDHSDQEAVSLLLDYGSDPTILEDLMPSGLSTWQQYFEAKNNHASYDALQLALERMGSFKEKKALDAALTTPYLHDNQPSTFSLQVSSSRSRTTRL